MKWKERAREIFAKKMEKMFPYVGVQYSEGPRPTVHGEEKEATFATVRPEVRRGKVESRIVNVYGKEILRRIYTEEDVARQLIERVKKALTKNNSNKK